MTKTFTDDNLLVWEAFPSGGNFGFSSKPYIVFNCLTNRLLRPRAVEDTDSETEAERIVAHASEEQLRELFRKSHEIG